jgi:hypothetical protein
MARYRLKAGLHQQADYSQQPTLVTNPATGEQTEQYPKKLFNPGEVVESDADLVVKHGADKFEYVDGGSSRKRTAHRAGDPNPEIAATSPAVFPQGQVSTGHQSTTVTEDGKHHSGPLPADHPLNRPEEAQGEEQADDGLEGMTKADLQAVAESEGVEVKHSATKAELVDAIRAHRSE